MSTAGCAEALLSQQRNPDWAGLNLLHPLEFLLAQTLLTRMLDEYEDMLRKEPGWVEREHTPPAPVRTGEPNPNPIPHWGPYGLIMGMP